MHVCTTADLGPGFTAMAVKKTNDTTVCLVTSRAQHDNTARANAIETLRREGIDCGTCPGCPAGLSRTT